MKQIFYKNTLRLNRGKLCNFDDLPDFAKNNFKLIKKELLTFSDYKKQVYVHGSFRWGFWSEDSDFDIIITEKIDVSKFKIFMLETYGVRVDIFILIPENDYVEIP